MDDRRVTPPRIPLRAILVSTILFDQLLPYLGSDQASYWASVLMVKPL